MRGWLLIVCIVFSTLATVSFAKDKGRDWRTGKLVSIEAGVPRSVGVVVGNIVAPVQYKSWVYTIETETMSYGFSAESSHPRSFTINSQVKFVLEANGKALLLDEKGKEFKAALVKTAAKQPAH
jgi:hypothetical protein